jgi:hypothetical protein
MAAPMTNVEAVKQTIAALIDAGHLDAGDAARITTAESLARACDLDPGNASLWREYRAAETALHEVRNAVSDDERDLVSALRTPMGDKPDTRAPHTRRTDRGRR